MNYQICVSGSVASGKTVESTNQLAHRLGQEIAAAGATLVTGATAGLPHHAAMGFSSVNSRKGVSVGFSPASSFSDHVAAYRLPTKEFDYINFTGMEYVGRDVHMVRSSDAIITVGGRMGSLHELSTALEGRKVCGILLGSGGLADYTKTLLRSIQTSSAKQVIYDTDPVRLIEQVVEELDKKYANLEQ